MGFEAPAAPPTAAATPTPVPTFPPRAARAAADDTMGAARASNRQHLVGP